jgi:RNA-directed DNA polymerase
MGKNILSLDAVDVREFFLNHAAYSNMELPPYFVFGKTLFDVEKILNGKELSEVELNKAKKNETINHVLYGNKDGKYAWRKYEIINPLIYVSLVNIITENKNWISLQERFKVFQQNKNIECESVPVSKRDGVKQKAAQISHWVENIEKKSVALSLEYNFLYQTDITDCYGSIYTHALPWAIHSKSISKNKRRYSDLFGNKIDQHIQAMSFGQTNGIPQGSILMDFFAEIILGYADSELSDKLSTELKNRKYHILRYRDDYRIFVNDISDGDKILKCLSEVLLGLGFRLNVGKTCFSDDVVSGSIKKDKFEALRFQHVPKQLTKEELLSQLLIIQQIGKQYPNSGTLKKRLSKIIDVVKLDNFRYQEKSIIGLLIDIAYNNPSTFPLISNLISSCLFKLPKKQQKELIEKIQSKICSLANIGLLEIWMQRISLGLKFMLNLNEKLCHIVNGNTHKIFETNWISNKAIKKIIDNNSYIRKNKLSKMKSRIEKKEVQIFNTYYS